ncbi:MAG: hypothetical protein ACM31C_09680 [Acidobacteriota bacterium]
MRCECGYNFHTGELEESIALARSQEHQLRAGRSIGRGIVMLAAIPVATVVFWVLCVALDTIAPMIAGVIVDLLLAVGGLGSIGSGVASQVNARRELRAVRERRRLPEARVVSDE